MITPLVTEHQLNAVIITIKLKTLNIKHKTSSSMQQGPEIKLKTFSEMGRCNKILMRAATVVQVLQDFLHAFTVVVIAFSCKF